ncbi:MAG: methionyl-tRNA formyltransferase [Vulcanimicrobiaceae bacterium]
MRAFAGALDCALVVTQPARPAGRGHKLQPTPVALAAQELGIATLTPERLREALEPLRATGADLYAVASYGKIVPQAILALPARGALNVHPSLLPLYRGATPLQSQLRDGVSQSGVTIIVMDAGMDTGDIVLQKRSPIGPAETYGELHDRFARLGAELLAQACAQAAAGTLTRTPQAGLASEVEIARTLTRPLTKDDLRVAGPKGDRGRVTAAGIVNLVRSLSAEPGARAELPGVGSTKILLAHALHGEGPAVKREPGEALLTRAGPLLRASDGWVVVDRLVPPGRKAMSGAEFAAGSRPAPADVAEAAELERWWNERGALLGVAAAAR